MLNQRRYLYLSVFIAGMTSLAVEMAASRLLGNVFGTSNLVWASIIGLILIYLTVGYFIGGRWADRSPHLSTFYKILAWAAFFVGLIPVISHPILRLSANAFDQLEIGVLLGSFVAVMILFSVPVTLLGTASPFAIRLGITDSREAGQISGRMYAISTLGGFLGTFLPTLVLIPTIGTFRTFLCFSGILLLVALVGLAQSSGWRQVLPLAWMPVLLVVLAWWGIQGPYKTSTGQIYESESAYNYIQVLEDNGFRYLRLNDGQGVHSMYSPTQINFNGPWEQVLVGPLFNPAPYDLANVKSLAIVGLAAGTTARQATTVYGPIPIDGFEIDPKIIAVGRQYFDMNEPNLNAIAQDGRVGLEHSTRKYTIISVDAYRPPYIPPHLTTQEFFQIVHQHLSEDGVLVINIGRAPNDRRLIDALATTVRTVFPSVYVMDLPGTFNSILYATVQPTQAGNLKANVQNLAQRKDTPPLLLASAETALANLAPDPQTTIVFSDDKAPVEWITNNIIISYVLNGNMEDLK
jgi:spermidine synthase